MITYKPFEPYTGTKFGVGGITSIKVQLALTAWNSTSSNLQCCFFYALWILGQGADT